MFISQQAKVVVVGGGAAGIFCAVNLARAVPGLQVIVLEKTNKLLSKVKISGGGRCNVTHNCFSSSELVKFYPRGGNFLKKAFAKFNATDTVAWFKERGVETHTESDGRMFPVTNSSQTIIDCLLKDAQKFGVEIRMQTGLKQISARHKDGFLISCSNGTNIQAQFVCIACGGFPKSELFSFLEDTGHTIIKPVPSLFTFNMPGNAITSLMGISLDNVTVKIAGTKLQQQGPMLITHWGMSGPAILKLSAWAAEVLESKNYHYQIVINWLPAFNENSLRVEMQTIRFNRAATKVTSKNSFGLPARLWEYITHISGVAADLRWADLPSKEQNKLIKNLCSFECEVKGKTTFKDEFVTCGGVDTNEIDPASMQSKLQQGLYFAGEVMNIDGVTGGFNFQHAWSSGFIAAQHMAEQIRASL